MGDERWRSSQDRERRRLRLDVHDPTQWAAAASAAVEALRRGEGVAIVGPRGSGRTYLAREILARAGDARHRVWWGDDIQGMSSAEVASVVETMRRGGLTPLTTQVPPSSATRPTRGLGSDTAAVFIQLGPYTPVTLRAIAEEIMEAPLSAAAVPALIPRRAASDLAVLREALAEMAAGGSLVMRDGTWEPGPGSQVGQGLRRFVLGRTDRLPGDRDVIETALDLLSLVPSLALGRARRIADRLDLDAGLDLELEALEEADLVVSSDRYGEPAVDLADGLWEHWVKRTIRPLRRRRLAEAAVEVLSSVPASDLADGELRALVDLAAETGHRIDSTAIVEAARASLRDTDAEATRRLAEAAAEAGAGFDARMILAGLDLQTGRTREALDSLHALAEEAEGDAQRIDALASLLRHAHERASDGGSVVDLTWTPEFDEDRRSRQDALRGFTLYSLDDPIGATGLLEPVLSTLSGEEQAYAQFIVANGAFVSGQLERAKRALDAAEEIHVRMGTDSSRVAMLRASVDAYSGHPGRSLALVRTFRDLAAGHGQMIPAAMCGWAAGMLLDHMGRMPEAVGELRDAAETLETAGLIGTTLLVRTALAGAVAQCGDELLASEALRLGPSGGRQRFEGQVHQAQGWVHVAGGRRAEAAASMRQASDHFLGRGYLLLAVLALRDEARVGPALPVRARIDAAAAAVEGPVAAACVRYVHVLADLDELERRGTPRAEDDPSRFGAAICAELTAVGTQFGRLGLHLLAGESHARAAVVWEGAGRAREAAAAAARRDEELHRCGLERTPLVPTTVTRPLSLREWEIASLAAEGFTNREISDRLVLSIRTVETHLLRTYKKLGLRRRSELAQALARNPQRTADLI